MAHDGKHMTVKAKLIASIVGVLLALLLVEIGVIGGFLLPRFEQIETGNAQASMRRIDLGVHNALEGLRVSATDWGNWADTYRFMQERNADYADENLNVISMKQLHLSTLAIIDAGGNIVWSYSFDLATEKPLKIDVLEGPQLPAGFPWLESLKDGKSHEGLIATNQGVMLTAVAPILNGYAQGPLRGLMLMGRLLTMTELTAIGRNAQTQVGIEAIRDPSGRFFLPAPRGPYASMVDRTLVTHDMMQISRTFRDVYGDAVLSLKVNIPRDISANARSTIGYMLAIVTGLSAALLLFLLGILNRITARMERARKEAEAEAAAKTSFVAIMSHEIRTPLNAILGFTHLCLQSALNPKQLDYLSKIQHASSTLMQIVNDILDFSKLEANLVELEDARFALMSVLTGVEFIVGDQARRKGLSFSIDRTSDVPAELRGDALRLEQILLNLVGNAVKFTSSGAINIAIAVTATDAKSVELEFRITDSGIGLSDEQIGRLFHAFTQADSSTTRQYGGTGLGLAICKRLVQAMGGRIWAEGRLGEGSLFAFTAKFGRLHTPLAMPQTLPEPPMAPAGPAMAEIVASLRDSRILVVEDNEFNQQVIAELLEQVGATVALAGTGQDALRQVSGDARFDAVLMDVQMPDMDGYEATRAIRAMPGMEKLVVIAITANATAEDRARCLEAGMTDFQPKPIDPQALYRTLSRHLAGR
jgi:signal transduction histidine kinase/ActR/RegA family two-component response regulator